MNGCVGGQAVPINALLKLFLTLCMHKRETKNPCPPLFRIVRVRSLEGERAEHILMCEKWSLVISGRKGHRSKNTQCEVGARLHVELQLSLIAFVVKQPIMQYEW